MASRCSVAVVGGGFYGCMIAEHYRRQSLDVVLIEKHDDLMQRASYANQARVHNGYHYPRSLLTALRSRVNFPRFVDTYRHCIDDSFEKVYAIARRFSKVTARHFENLCERIDVPLAPAPERIRKLFDPGLVEAVYSVREYAFDSVKLKADMWDRLTTSGVRVLTGTEVSKVAAAGPGEAGRLTLTLKNAGGTEALHADRVFNCTFSRINVLLADSGLPTIPLKHEVAEMALVAMPDELKDVGVTVMCGPFFSCMPFPARGLHSFSHVRYTPHTSWSDDGGTLLDGHRYLESLEKKSHFPAMLRDAVRYLPALAGCEQRDSLWEIKTVLPASERDDSRPILLKHDAGLPGLSCVLAAKIDNVFDVLDVLDQEERVPGDRKAA